MITGRALTVKLNCSQLIDLLFIKYLRKETRKGPNFS